MVEAANAATGGDWAEAGRLLEIASRQDISVRGFAIWRWRPKSSTLVGWPTSCLT